MEVPQYLVGLFHGKSQSKMDDDWGYPYFRKPSHINVQKLQSERP